MDRLILGFDRALRTLSGVASSRRPMPGADLSGELAGQERKHVAGLMRVNHSGEVCAQALYQGQAAMARSPELREVLLRAADEEVEHLDWTARRVRELGASTSRLDPFWFLGAFAIGAGFALLGDRWSLGFLEEAERQVVEHLEGHLAQLPAADQRTRAIIELMRDDEAGHADTAASFGAGDLPEVVKQLMRLAARVMTGAAYRI